MEVAKYLCEFFFCNFWHWLALTITIAAAHGGIFNFGDSYHVDDNSKKEESNG